MNNMEKVPFIDDRVLEYLNRIYPDKSPEPTDTDREIWINRGAIGVVRHLAWLHKQQRENLLGEIDDVLLKRP